MTREMLRKELTDAYINGNFGTVDRFLNTVVETVLRIEDNEKKAKEEVTVTVTNNGTPEIHIPRNAIVVMEDGNRRLVASFYDEGHGYIGVNVDAEIGDQAYYLCNAELPRENDPLTTRLYAGNAECEADSPIAKMVHGIRPDKADEERRILYVDRDFVEAVSWNDAKECDSLTSSSRAFGETAYYAALIEIGTDKCLDIKEKEKCYEMTFSGTIRDEMGDVIRKCENMKITCLLPERKMNPNAFSKEYAAENIAETHKDILPEGFDLTGRTFVFVPA